MLVYCFCFALFSIRGQKRLLMRAISKYKPPGGLYSEGRFNAGFFVLQDLV